MSDKAEPELQSLYLPLYFDEDVPIDITTNLQSRGFDAISTRDVSRLGQDDDSQLAFAIQEKRALVTHNRADFEARHEQCLLAGQVHYGIIIAKRRPHDEMVVMKLLALLNRVTAEEMHNQLRYV